MPRPRFPRSVYDSGTEPDARFSLANERTFLTWISTSLALISVGVALESLAAAIQPALRLAASLVLVVLGVSLPIQAWFRWAGIEAALRHQRPLRPAMIGLTLAIGVGSAGLLVGIGILV